MLHQAMLWYVGKVSHTPHFTLTDQTNSLAPK
jgi:hypothetical protein